MYLSDSDSESLSCLFNSPPREHSSSIGHQQHLSIAIHWGLSSSCDHDFPILLVLASLSLPLSFTLLLVLYPLSVSLRVLSQTKRYINIISPWYSQCMPNPPPSLLDNNILYYPSLISISSMLSTLTFNPKNSF